jgi:hypothetical protein
MKRNCRLLAALSLLIFVSLSAKSILAETIDPGGTTTLNPYISPFSTSGWTLIATNSVAGGSGNWSDTLTEAVYASSSGTLNFVFQVANTSPITTVNNDTDYEVVIALMFSSFADVQTNVGLVVDPSTLPGNPFADPTPTRGEGDVSRSADGSTLTVNGNALGDFTLTGEVSVLTTIETNATTYDSNGTLELGFIDLQHLGLPNPSGPGPYPPNVFGSTSGIFEPIAPPPPPPSGMPEPTTANLLGFGLFGLIAFGFAHKQFAKS